MIEELLKYLETCPLIEQLTFGALAPGGGTGLFAGGIEKVEQDILGDSRVTQSYILRHRDTPDSTWAQQVSRWLLCSQPTNMTVIPRGGKLVSPTKEGWGTWELELIVS